MTERNLLVVQSPGGGPYLRYVVGGITPGWPGHPVAEGGEFNIDVSGTRLRLGYAAPKQSEAVGFNTGVIQFGLVRATERTFFFLFNIKNCTDGWCDASFALGLVHSDNRDIAPREPDRGWLVTMHLMDVLTGKIAALRASTMTPAFSAQLEALVAEQRASLPTFTRERYSADIAAAHRRWKHPNDMVADAIITEVAGQKF